MRTADSGTTRPAVVRPHIDSPWLLGAYFAFFTGMAVVFAPSFPTTLGQIAFSSFWLAWDVALLCWLLWALNTTVTLSRDALTIDSLRSRHLRWADVREARWRIYPGHDGSLKLVSDHGRVTIRFGDYPRDDRRRLQELLHDRIPPAAQRHWNYFALKQGLLEQPPEFERRVVRVSRRRLVLPWLIAAPLVPMVAITICLAIGAPVAYPQVLSTIPVLLAFGAAFWWGTRNLPEGLETVAMRDYFPWLQRGRAWIAFRLLTPVVALGIIALWPKSERLEMHAPWLLGGVLLVVFLVMLGQCVAEERWQRQEDTLAADAAVARANASAHGSAASRSPSASAGA